MSSGSYPEISWGFDLLLNTTLASEHLKVPSRPVMTPSPGLEVPLRALRSPALLLNQQQRPRPTSRCCTSGASKKYTGQRWPDVGVRKGTWCLGRCEGEKASELNQGGRFERHHLLPVLCEPHPPKVMMLKRQNVIITQDWFPGPPGWLGKAMLSAGLVP